MKIRQVGAKLFQRDRHYKTNSRFLKFYKRAQNLNLMPNLAHLFKLCAIKYNQRKIFNTSKVPFQQGSLTTLIRDHNRVNRNIYKV
jgi:hypothetical protein